jgi:beta-glucanase (GH16 family)
VQWTPQWCDEFNGGSFSVIDSSKWQFERGNLGVNNELEYYCGQFDGTYPCDFSNPNAYIDGNGHLVIQALRINNDTSPGSNAWTSARLNTGNNLANFKYGRIEANLALPSAPGLWPAWWALGSNIAAVPWPGCGEMDFMENVPASSGLGPTIVQSTIHGPGYSGSGGLGQKYTFPSNDPFGPDVTSYHTYGALWSPFMVQFYVDDPSNVFFVRTASDTNGNQWVFNNPFFVLLNLAVGGVGSWPGPPDSTTPSPSQMLVDYVRYYQPSAVTPPNLSNPAGITVTAGETGTTTVNLNSTAGTGRVYLNCSTTAPKTTCSIATSDTVNAATVDFGTSTSGSATLSVTTTANTALASLFPLSWLGAVPASLLVLFALGFGWSSLRTRSRLAAAMMAGVAVFLMLTWTACSGSGGSPTPPPNNNGTPPGTYTVTVNAYTLSSDPANGNTYGTVNVTLTVN